MTRPVGTPEDRTARLVTIGPISVMALPATEGQRTVIAKGAAAFRRDSSNVFSALDIVFRVVQALLVNPEDVDRIDSGLIDGSIAPSDLAGVLGLGEDDDDSPKPTKAIRTRRGR